MLVSGHIRTNNKLCLKKLLLQNAFGCVGFLLSFKIISGRSKFVVMRNFHVPVNFTKLVKTGLQSKSLFLENEILWFISILSLYLPKIFITGACCFFLFIDFNSDFSAC